MAKCKTSISLVSKKTSAISLVSNLTKQAAGKQSKKNTERKQRVPVPRCRPALVLRTAAAGCESSLPLLRSEHLRRISTCPRSTSALPPRTSAGPHRNPKPPRPLLAPPLAPVARLRDLAAPPGELATPPRAQDKP
jgi:hypothetical protein